MKKWNDLVPGTVMMSCGLYSCRSSSTSCFSTNSKWIFFGKVLFAKFKQLLGVKYLAFKGMTHAVVSDGSLDSAAGRVARRLAMRRREEAMPGLQPKTIFVATKI